MKIIITTELLRQFAEYLKREEKSAATIDKYSRDAVRFKDFLNGDEVCKENVIAFKHSLSSAGYKDSSINSMLSSINKLLEYLKCDHYKVKNIRIQKKIYCPKESQLTREEYFSLVASAENESLSLILQTVCSTGIRISELEYFTIDNVLKGEVTVNCKNKTRTIIIPQELCEKLLSYTKCRGIKTGAIFVTKNGNPIDRSNIWRQMKKCCIKAGVDSEKVYPHNLRKLFARTFYQQEKDIAVLADVLGHSSIETTRIYIMTNENEHRKKIETLNLLV